LRQLAVLAFVFGVLLICISTLDWLSYGDFLWALWVQ
jgi:hypothetical protein